jgi:hypothetical protein
MSIQSRHTIYKQSMQLLRVERKSQGVVIQTQNIYLRTQKSIYKNPTSSSSQSIIHQHHHHPSHSALEDRRARRFVACEPAVQVEQDTRVSRRVSTREADGGRRLASAAARDVDLCALLFGASQLANMFLIEGSSIPSHLSSREVPRGKGKGKGKGYEERTRRDIPSKTAPPSDYLHYATQSTRP